MNKSLPAIAAILLGLALCACNLPQGVGLGTTPQDTVATQVTSTLVTSTETVQATPQDTPTPTASATPSEPTLTPSPSQTPTVSETPIPKPGSISGSILGYPYGSVPRLAIVAFEQEAPYNYSYWLTAPGDTYFTLSSQYIVPGQWQVVAYDPDGHAGGCPIIIMVVSDQTVNCNVTDWSGSYPARPSGVPSP
jgi:hypothetical protein